MSAGTPPNLSAADLDYAKTWCDCTARILESLHGSPFTGALQAAPAASDLPAEDQSLWVRFKTSGRLEGEHSFQLAKSDAVRLSQLLMSEPMDASVPYNDSHTDALTEIFRQFAGFASTACKSKYDGEVQFQLEGASRPEWVPAATAMGVFAAPQVAPIQWILFLSAELHAVLGVLEAAREAKPSQPSANVAAGVSTAVPPVATPAASPVPIAPASAASAPPTTTAATAAVPSAVAQSGALPANLDLLLDVELDASLRFGQREMILRDILELRPGSVVELNRQLQEPAELLVAGRVIARGEVVIVDGSYGLRITDIAQPQQRLASVQT